MAGASRPDVIELNIRGVLNDTADTTGVLDDIDGTSLDWNLRAQAEWSELRGLYEINPSTIDGSLAGLDLMASGGFVNQSATRVSFDGVASNRLSMLGGFLAFPMDSLDFVISAAVRFDDGSTFGFQFAGFVSLPLDIYDYGDDVLEEDMIVNPFELRDTFAGAVQTTGSITGYSVSIVPTPATVGVVAVGGIVASRRRR
ncbi:MAG: hypothetical protein AAGI53_03320 [Planctomycetota bacterium]